MALGLVQLCMQIPTPKTLPVTRKPCTTDGMKYEQVVFDLETTPIGTFRNDSPERVDVFFEMSPVNLLIMFH